MYQNMVKSFNAGAIVPSKASAIDLLIEYLTLPNAEDLFKGHAVAYSMSLLDSKLMKNNLAFTDWKTIMDEVNLQTHFTDADYRFPTTFLGTWVPRSSNAHLQIYAGIPATELKKKGPVAVCAVLNDEKDQHTDKYENEWNGFWQFFNIMQFVDQFVAVSKSGFQNMDYAKYMELLKKDVNLIFIDNLTISTDYIRQLLHIAQEQDLVARTSLESTVKLLLIVELDRVGKGTFDFD